MPNSSRSNRKPSKAPPVPAPITQKYVMYKYKNRMWSVQLKRTSGIDLKNCSSPYLQKASLNIVKSSPIDFTEWNEKVCETQQADGQLDNEGKFTINLDYIILTKIA